jgi:predicted dinucleotide-binding enzyme
MKIGIIGSGGVGGTLGTRWAEGGHSVTFSSRRPDSPEMTELVAKAGPNAKAAPVTEAVANSEVVLLATPWPTTLSAVSAAGSMEGKVLIDATNPLLPDFSALEFGTTTSGGEQVAARAPGASVVKAFNTVGFNVMADPAFGERRASLFYCGDDPKAKQVVHQLAEELGFDPHDAGSLTQARTLEPFAFLWISLALVQGYGREMAFDLIRR